MNIAAILNPINHFFEPGDYKKPGPWFRVYLAILFIAGALFWVKFLEFGQEFYSNHDWGLVYFLISVLETAFSSGQIPLHVSRIYHDTSRILTVAEMPLSPQYLLLLLLKPKAFILANSLLLYTIGFAGSYLLGKKFSLSPFAFTAFFLLFNFNGHFLAHIAVGHYIWIGLFFLPFFLLFVSELFMGNTDPKIPAYLSFSLLGMLLQGSMHIFNFCLLFLGLCFFFIPKNKKAVLVSMVFSILFASFRYIPATVTYYERGFVRGYTNYQNLLHLLTRIAPFDLYAINGVGLWEFYFFIGGLGLGFVLLFGVLPIFVKEIRLTPPELTSLHLPILLMAVLSIGTVWESLTLFSKLSVLTAERVPARFLIISFLFLALFSSIQLDRVLARFRAPLALKIAALAGLVYEGYVLLQNGRVWRLYEINTTVLKFKEPKNLDYRLSIINHVDPAYTTPLLIAWGITILSVLFVLYYTRRRSANSS